MRNPAYPYPKYQIILIAEQSALEEYQSGPIQLELKEEEIADIRNVLHKITRRRVMNAGDAEDIVQDTLLTMLVRNPGRNLRKGMLAWCQGILRNKVGNYYRKSRRHTALGEQNAVHQQQFSFSTKTAPQETLVSNRELHHLIVETISAFPRDTRNAMELLVSGLKTGEIVDQLSPEPYQNVINRLYRGRRKLARELIKCGFGPGARKNPGRKYRGTQSGPASKKKIS